ncbi:GHKL domain-containing protein [Mucilaginibacter pallidiroseus]|uniref:histidine kinase n=1 Tax=Mucilaginibacter pallidiroseus TaxID=2599295 RepID=A0A563U807_9SPHI|nr:ATP-binding protein [Mucilaginibacter pallidiroseus]TWR27511.1 GHKL domain-containing protein [Mucilaginibacter pallidiroseus]
MDITIDELKAIPALQAVPDEQLQWLIDVGEVFELREGERIFNVGDPINKMFIILEGAIRLCAVQNGKMRELATIKKDGITGFLPYSRATNAFGYGECTQLSRFYQCTAEDLKEGTRLHYELTEALVHTMTSRVRDFTSMQQQNEKMFALGKLSAGLAHELNNPAAAITRGAASLRGQIKNLPLLFKDVATLNIEPHKIDSINNLILERVSQTDRPVLSMMKRSELEDDLYDWLLDHNAKDVDTAENLVDFDFSIDDLEHINSCIPSPQLQVVLGWINNYLLTEKMAQDISESSQRISELVQSVKTFTHMDRDSSKQLLNVHDGIRNTLTMLDYKLRKANIQVVHHFDENLPHIKALAGELNQVWTNIIDNAIDAMEVNGSGELEISTRQDKHFVQVILKDNGPGIPDEIKSQIFDPFFSTKDIGKGSGLGLDVVNRIVKQHNGSVKVTSVPGDTEFEVCFPINDD